MRAWLGYLKVAVALPIVLLPPVYLGIRALAPRPWSDHAITATFDRLALDKTSTNLEFHYTLHNHSREDFHHELGAPLVLTPHRAPVDPYSALAEPQLEFPVDAPRGSTGTLVIRAGIVMPTDQQLRRLRREDPSTAEVEDWLRSTLTRLDGFTLTDRRHRLLIRLPKGR